MPGGIYDLYGKRISATYHRVVQYDSSSLQLLDGRGDAIIESSIGCDLFINNSYIDGHQIDIFTIFGLVDL